MMTTSSSIELYAVSTYNSRKSAFREALPQIIAVSVKNILVFSFGTSLGYPTILIPNLSSNNPDEIFHLDDNQISWIGSINIMCIPIGSFFSGFVTQPYGRKRSMQAITFPWMASWIAISFSTQVWHIYIALAIIGVCGGLLLAPILTYVAEVTQPHLRGMLSATSTLSMMLGILLQFFLGAFFNWRTIAVVCGTLPVLSFILLIFVPESPHWLIMNDRMKEARQNLAWLKGWCEIEEIESEFQEILGHIKPCYGSSGNQINSEKLNIFSKITKYYLRKSFLSPLILLSFCFFASCFTGSATLQTYAIKIFEAFEVPINKYYATIVLGVAEFLGSVISVCAVHYAGKRLLGLISIIGSGICAAVIAFYAHINDVYYFSDGQNSTYVPEISNPEVDEYKEWIPFVFLILLAFLSQCGIINLPWVLIAEVFAKHTRAVGCGITCAISSFFVFSTNKIFLKTVLLFTIPGTYCIYAGVSFLSSIILYLILPETEGKTLEEISDHFAGISKLDYKVRRHNKNFQETSGRSGTYQRIK